MKHLFKWFCKEVCVNTWIKGRVNEKMTNNDFPIKPLTTAVIIYTMLCEIRAWYLFCKYYYTFLYILYIIFNIENLAEICRVSHAYIYIYTHIYTYPLLELKP